MRTRGGLSRREFLKLAGAIIPAAVLGACVPRTSEESEVGSMTVAGTTVAQVQFTPVPAEEFRSVTITVVYDNVGHDTRLSTVWGFSAVVDCGDQRVLFDTGGDSPTLLGNMAILEIDPASIQKVMVSHIHDDHVGGLPGLLQTGVRPTVYVPPSFPRRFNDQVSQLTDLVEVTPGQAIADGMFTTGEMPTPGYPGLVEQALVVESRGGSIVITGCAHPGIVDIVKRAKELFDAPVFLVMGGFHLADKGEAQVNHILVAFRELGVEHVAPSHCTGELAIAKFAEEYGDDFIYSGAGSIINIP